MGKVAITGYSFLTTIGESIEQNFDKLYISNSTSEDLEVDEQRNKRVRLAKKIDLKNFDSSTSFQRLPNAYKYAMYVVGKALVDANINLDEVDEKRIGLFMGTGLAAISSVEKFYNPIITKGLDRGSPLCFPNTTSSVGCGLIGMKFNVQGKSLAISSGGVSGMQGIEIATMSLETDELDIAIIVGTDEITETVYNAFKCTRMISDNEEGECWPYISQGAKHNTTVLGEGAAAIIIEREDFVKKRGGKVKAFISSVCNSCNVTMRGYNWKLNCELLMQVISKSGYELGDIDVIVGAGNGNLILDNCELKALSWVFWKSVPYLFVPSIYFGDTDGASSILNIICGVSMLERKKVMEMPEIYKRKLCEKIGFVNEKAKESKVNTILVLANSYYGDISSTILYK